MKEAEKKADRKFGEFTLFVGDKGLIGTDGHLISARRAQGELPAAAEDVAARPRRADRRPVLRASNGGTPGSNFPDAAAR